MIHPSYSELMEAVNQGNENEEEPVVNSRYSIVIATSKRARQIIAGSDTLLDKDTEGIKPLSVAVEELYTGRVKIESQGTEDTEEAEAAALEEAESPAEEG